MLNEVKNPVRQHQAIGIAHWILRYAQPTMQPHPQTAFCAGQEETVPIS